MASKKISLSAEVDVTTMNVQVTGAPGGAGVAVASSTASSAVVLTNTSRAGVIQYKVDSGAWADLSHQSGITLPINFTSNTLYLRRATWDGGDDYAHLSIEGSVSGLTGPSGQAIAVSGGGGDLQVTGSQVVNGVLTAKYSKGSGTVQFTRTPIGGTTATPFGSVASSGATYTVQTSDRGYQIGAAAVTYLPPPTAGLPIPSVAPLAPTITGVSAGNGSVTATFTRNADNGGDTVTGDRLYVYRASDDSPLGQANGTSPITLTGIANGVAVYTKAATIGATNGVGPLSAASSSVTPTAVVVNAVNMVIFAGQSQTNSNGNTSAQTVPTAISGPMTDVYIWDPFVKTWVTYQAGVNSSIHLKAGLYPDTSNQYFGAEAEYARRWKVDNPGVPLYMIKKGHSTTSLAQVARPANRGCWDPALRGDLFDELVTWVSDAKANLVAAGKTVNLRGMNWVQGETDTGPVTNEAALAYGTNLSLFVDGLRSYGVLAATTPFIISRIQINQAWPYPQLVRTAQQSVGESKAYCRWFDCDTITLDGSDSVHYGPNGVVTHGDLMYEEGMTGLEAATLYASKMTVPPPSDRIAKLGVFFDSLINNGIWSGTTALQIYASHTSQAALLNARNLPVTATNSGMTFTPDQGFTGTSTASFVNTGINPVTGDTRLVRGNVSYGFYIRGNIATTGVDCGFNPTTSGNGVVIGATQTGATGNFRINNSNTSADNNYAGIADVSGLWSASRKSLNACTLFNKGVQIGTTDTVNADVGESSNVIFVGNRNSSNNTSGTNGTLRQYGMFIAGSGRTPAQEVALNNAVSTYLTSIGAN